MVATASPVSMQATLSQWLRLLWDRAPELRLDSEQPYIEAGVIHLPARSHWQQHAAAAAHATAHLVYSPAAFDGRGLAPMARCLVALLEDARVEALAMRELPGLARLWLPLHSATPALGSSLDALMQRLTRALVDPAYDDPDPWVRKGRALFFLDARLGLLALRTVAEVRHAASLLAHDAGQMRSQLNVKNHRPVPAYRDDHRWMWAAELAGVPAPPPAAVGADDAADDAEHPPNAADVVAWHPEWDRLIARLRPDWCRVVERQAQPGTTEHAVADGAVGHTARLLRGPLQALARRTAVPRRDEDGEQFDLDALVDWRIAVRLRGRSDGRVYRGPDRCKSFASVWLLIDQSASTASMHAPGGPSVLQVATRLAAAVALALQGMGVACAVGAFNSRGRYAVSLQAVKAFAAPVDSAVLGRLQALRSGGSTRLGAALRHAAGRLAERRGRPCWVLVLSDGDPHDIDVHDPRYLVEDARQAVRAAARIDVRTACLAVASDGGAAARLVFGRGDVQPVQGLRDLPGALRRLLG